MGASASGASIAGALTAEPPSNELAEIVSVEIVSAEIVSARTPPNDPSAEHPARNRWHSRRRRAHSACDSSAVAATCPSCHSSAAACWRAISSSRAPCLREPKTPKPDCVAVGSEAPSEAPPAPLLAIRHICARVSASSVPTASAFASAASALVRAASVTS